MARHRSHSIEFKRQVAQQYLSGETLQWPGEAQELQQLRREHGVPVLAALVLFDTDQHACS